jgi:hypothetical protein
LQSRSTSSSHFFHDLAKPLSAFLYWDAILFIPRLSFGTSSLFVFLYFGPFRGIISARFHKRPLDSIRGILISYTLSPTFGLLGLFGEKKADTHESF